MRRMNMLETTMMLPAFLILVGVVCFYCMILKVNMGEGTFLSASTVMLLLVLSSCMFHTFQYGMYAMYVLAVIGAVLLVIAFFQRKKKKKQLRGSGALLILFLLYLIWLILYHNDFIQHIDEFHEWAAAVRYMLLHDKMPTGYDFIGGGGQYGFATSLFLLFFQKLSGYSEQNMYVASSLLTFIGFLLPFSGYEKKDLKKVWIYVGILYIGLYSLYSYGTKSIYVDMPTAAWAGGLAGWWMNRNPQKKKSNVLILLTGMITLHFMKQSQGLLMAVFVLLFAITYTCVIESKAIQKAYMLKRIRIIAIILGVLTMVGTAGIIGVVSQIQTVETVQVLEDGQESVKVSYEFMGKELSMGAANWVQIYTLNGEKAKETLKSFLKNAMGAVLAGKSNLKLAFVPFIGLLLILVTIYGDLYEKKREACFFRAYMIVMAAVYCAVLYLSFVLMFTYALSVDVKSSPRYFSGCAVYLMVIVMTLLLGREEIQKKTALKYVLCGVGAMFLYGINTKYIPNMTALDKDDVGGFENIMAARQQSDQIKDIIGSEERVYYIYQVGENTFSQSEYVNAPALYYMDTQISNYMGEPWRFTETGSNVGLELREDITLQNLPELLENGGYQYVWLYMSDKYLSQNLPDILNFPDGEINNGLYRVIYEDGHATGLEYVQELGVEETDILTSEIKES